MLDTIVAIITQTAFELLKRVPYKVRYSVFYLLIRLVVLLVPRYRKIADKNLSLIYQDKKKRDQIVKDSYHELARLVADVLLSAQIGDDWVKKNINFPYAKRYQEFKEQHPTKGVLFASGHFGSFELMGCVYPFFGIKINSIARPFKNKKIDDWWNGIRTKHGNGVIPRSGALKGFLKSLKKGQNVGILFDQNVTRNYAVFVDWFGRPAATTKALAMTVLRTSAPVVVCGILYKDGAYEIVTSEHDFTTVCEDNSLSDDQKIVKITETVSKSFQDIIMRNPPGWFWMHRRWKTSEDPNEDRAFYE